MDNKQLYHIAGEVIVVASLSMYFMKQLKIQKDELKELRDDVKKHQEQTNKNLEMIYKILNKAFNINTQPFENQPQQTTSQPSQQQLHSEDLQNDSQSSNNQGLGSSKERFSNPLQQNSMPIMVQGNSLAMLAMANPVGIGIIQETHLRHRNRSPQTDIQIMDDSQNKQISVLGKNKEDLGFSKQKLRELENNLDSDNDEDIMEELAELETEDEQIHIDEENNVIKNNIEREQVNEESEKQEEVMEKPFYPEPSKKKKIQKK